MALEEKNDVYWCSKFVEFLQQQAEKFVVFLQQ